MNKKGLKINTEYNKWNQPNLVIQIKKEFLAFVKSSKKDKDFINNIDFIGWDRIIEICNIEIESLVQAFEIPSAFATEIWYTTFYEIEILKLIKNYLFPKILLEMEKIEGKHINQRKKIINKITKQAELDIKDIVELFKIQLKFSSLKWIKDSDTKQSTIDVLKKKYSKSYGKKYHKDNIEHYRKIYKKNDEYIERDGEGNYRKAARNVIKFSDSTFENIYKSFNKFKNKNNILTLEEFNKFLSTIDGR